jgi:hypothetical protein
VFGEAGDVYCTSIDSRTIEIFIRASTANAGETAPSTKESNCKQTGDVENSKERVDSSILYQEYYLLPYEFVEKTPKKILKMRIVLVHVTRLSICINFHV